MTPYPWYKKINPFWWFGNYNDPVNGLDADGTPKHGSFHSSKPLWIRKILWGIRNPLSNFMKFVIGFQDRPEIVNMGKQWPADGQKWNITMPFISYRGKKYEFYLGWRKGLTVGAAFRGANSKPM
jgi:hypothetical protein